MRALGASLAALSLAGCVSSPAVDISAQCLPLKGYTTKEQTTLAKEWSALDPKSLTASEFIPDAIKMRDADRTCLAARSKGSAN